MTPDTAALTPREETLVEHLLDAGVLRRQDLEYALKIRARMQDQQPLEETLVGLELIDREVLQEQQHRLHARLSIAELLVTSGRLSAEALAEATAGCPEGTTVVQHLLELERIEENDLLRAQALRAGLPYLEPNSAILERDLLKVIPMAWLHRHAVLPVRRLEGGIQVACGAPPTPDLLQELTRRLQGPVVPVLAPTTLIQNILRDVETIEIEVGGTGDEDVQHRVVHAVDHIIAEAVRMEASDIHLEPLAGCLRLRYRLDGVLVHRTDIAKELAPRISARIKILADLDIAEHRRHQDGRFTCQVEGQAVDMRVSTYITVHGENLVLRILNKKMGLLKLSDLGMPPRMLRDYRDFVLGAPAGVVVITGPTGSGKTTTLYSSIAHCNSMGIKIITAEDPVEYQIDGIMQCSINERIGLTFEDTLRAIVRQDPDTIVLGEIRDRTSAETAIQAALTGHKVFTTFHTEDSVGGLLRLMNMEIETFLISSTVICMVAQRLVRRLCPRCREATRPTPRELHLLRLDRGYFDGWPAWRSRGCDACHYTGFKGRAAIYELLVLGNAVKDALLERRTSHHIRELSIKESGLVTLQESGIALVAGGVTTLEEILHKAPASFRPRPIGEIFKIIGTENQE